MKITRLVIDGQTFLTYEDIAKAYNLHPGTVSKRVKNGCTIDQIIAEADPKHKHSTKPISIEIDGKTFPSISAAARCFDIAPASFYLAVTQALYKGTDIFVSDAPRRFYPGKGIEINNVYYPSITIAARELNINYQTLCSRIKSGYYLPKEQRPKIHRFEFKGEWYENRDACAMHFGVSPEELKHRVDYIGMSLEEALDPVLSAKAEADFRARKYEERIARRDARREARSKGQKIIPQDIGQKEQEYIRVKIAEAALFDDDDFEKTFG